MLSSPNREPNVNEVALSTRRFLKFRRTVHAGLASWLTSLPRSTTLITFWLNDDRDYLPMFDARFPCCIEMYWFVLIIHVPVQSRSWINARLNLSFVISEFRFVWWRLWSAAQQLQPFLNQLLEGTRCFVRLYIILLFVHEMTQQATLR